MSELFENDSRGAEFSICRKYRYALWRIWDKSLPLVMFIGLNPSTADEKENDPTIRFVEGISKHNGFGGFYMMNCWAYVATKPEDLQHNPMSDQWNDNMLTVIASKCSEVVFAWGNFKVVKQKGRDKDLMQMFPHAKCLWHLKDGSPKHPLYAPFETTFIKFSN